MDAEGNPVIDVSISYGFGEDNRYALENIPQKIQLASYKYDSFMRMKDKISKAISRRHTRVNVVHLPLDTLRRKYSEIHDMIKFCFNELGTWKYVIHPNKGIGDFVGLFEQKWADEGIRLCIETFQYRKKKAIRSPLDIMEWCIRIPVVDMTIDTSHIEEIWMDHRIMKTLLQYTSVIHLSNKSRKLGQHLPFNHPEGDLNLVGFVRDLKYRYKWEGDLVLEYMPEHKHKLVKNKDYIERLLA